MGQANGGGEEGPARMQIFMWRVSETLHKCKCGALSLHAPFGANLPDCSLICAVSCQGALHNGARIAPFVTGLKGIYRTL